ncbi:MAG TPA: hypothetical protein VHO69_16480 [Phototrophicaceae bacterium]|nr:hypothetical protein [Phototrophicaceae bacterium]
MAIQARWLDNDKKTVVREFVGAWTWEEFYASQTEVNDLLRSVAYNVHQIMDFRQASHVLPANTLTHIGHSGKAVPPNRGKSIVVVQNTFFKQMYGLLDRIFPTVTERVILVATLEEALEAIRAGEKP